MISVHRYLIYSLLLVFLFSAGTIQAQIQIGANVGASYSTFSLKSFEDQPGIDEFQYGYTPGIFVSIPIEYSFNGPLALQTELNFIQKGMETEYAFIEDPQNYTKFQASSSLNYVQTPLLMKVKLGKGPFRASVYAGPAVSFMVSGNQYSLIEALIMGDYYSEESNEAVDFDDSLNRWEISVIAGIGLELDAGPGAFTLDLRYHQGLTSLSKSPDIKFLNRGFSSALGYKIKF